MDKESGGAGERESRRVNGLLGKGLRVMGGVEVWESGRGEVLVGRFGVDVWLV